MFAYAHILLLSDSVASVVSSLTRQEVLHYECAASVHLLLSMLLIALQEAIGYGFLGAHLSDYQKLSNMHLWTEILCSAISESNSTVVAL